MLPISEGDCTIAAPAAINALCFACAVPARPAMIAPAWPMRRPGGAVVGRREVLSIIEIKDSGKMNFARRVPHQGTFNANPLSAAAGNAALDLVATGEPQRDATTLNQTLVRRLNEAIRDAGIAGCAYGHASMFHLILGAECPPPVDDFTWNWQSQPSHRVPVMSTNVSRALRRGMINEGVDLMDTGGMVSAAHTEEDAERTIAALRRTIAQMKEEEIL